MTGLQMKYFVLNPHKQGAYGAAARAAMKAFAASIVFENSILAGDLIAWVESAEQEAPVKKAPKKKKK